MLTQLVTGVMNYCGIPEAELRLLYDVTDAAGVRAPPGPAPGGARPRPQPRRPAGMTEQGRAGPVALVTGAGRRIGAAIARDLARHGWAVAIHYRGSRREAEALAREIEAAGGRAVTLACDLAREAEVETLIPRAVEALGPLTCLVNNASAFEMDKIDTATRESWDRHIETNLRAPLVLSQAFARQLPEEHATGNIINMLDQRVWKLTPYFLSYTVAKSGLWTLTQTLALALAPRIRVNGIGPGPDAPQRTPERRAVPACSRRPCR